MGVICKKEVGEDSRYLKSGIFIPQTEENQARTEIISTLQRRLLISLEKKKVQKLSHEIFVQYPRKIS